MMGVGKWKRGQSARVHLGFSRRGACDETMSRRRRARKREFLQVPVCAPSMSIGLEITLLRMTEFCKKQNRRAAGGRNLIFV